MPWTGELVFLTGILEGLVGVSEIPYFKYIKWRNYSRDGPIGYSPVKKVQSYMTMYKIHSPTSNH
jgi:hypothetical protein